MHSLLDTASRIRECKTWRSRTDQALALLQARLRQIGAPMAAGVGVVLLFFGSKGMLGGFIRFHASLGDQSTYGAQPASVVQWSLPFFRYEMLFMLLFFVLAFSFTAWFRDGAQCSSAYAAALTVGFAGLVVMQKNVFRPPIFEQVSPYPVIAALMCVVAVWPRRTRMQLAVAAAAVGLVLGVGQYKGVVRSDVQALARGPSMLLADYRVWRGKAAEMAAVNASLYAPDRLEFPAQKEVVDALRTTFGWTASESLYVLGDDQPFYMITGGPFPFVANNYNSSPIGEQERIVRWLREQKPRFVVWKPAEMSFDNVPNLVRCPLLYQFVAEHYRFVKSVGSYDILTSAAELSDADWRYWADRFGRRLDMGWIPKLATASAYKPCPPNAEASCQLVVTVTAPPRPGPERAVLTIGPFEMTFIAKSGGEYLFDLDRLWFRSQVTAASPIRVSIEGASAKAGLRSRRSGVLY